MQEEKRKEKGFTKLGFLGGDVSKGTCNFVLQDENSEELEENFQLDDNRQGHKTLYELIENFRQEHGLKKIIVGLESTGGYENNWYKGMRNRSEQLGVEVFRINPKLIFFETKADGQKSVTDGISARVIAGFLRKNYGTKSLASHRLENAPKVSDTFSSMRNLHKYIERKVTHCTRTKNALEKLLYSTMPEMLSLKGTQYPNWFLELLIKYPNKSDILNTDIESITSIPFLSKGKAEQIKIALQESVGATADKYTSLAIQEQARDIQQLQKQINVLKEKLVSLGKEENQIEEDMEILTSISGIAEDTAISILMEMEQPTRFEKGKNLVAFWGMNPTIKQSGDKKYKIGMSKDGSSSARATMFMAAKNVVRHEPYFANIYHQKRNKGKSHYSAMGIVMTKLTRVVYGMLKSRKKFDSKVDVTNQSKVVNQNSRKKEEQKNCKNLAPKGERRYQDKQNTAPVSMTQRVKRKQEQNVPS